VRCLNEIPRVSFSDDVITRRPRIPLALLAEDPAAFVGLKHALVWAEEAATAADGSA
jgi:hypothetical protein